MDLLEGSDDLAEEDRDAIHRWTIHLRTNDPDTQPLGTVGHLDRIRPTVERSSGREPSGPSACELVANYIDDSSAGGRNNGVTRFEQRRQTLGLRLTRF